MYTITKEQASNFWCYFTLPSPIEISCYSALPKIFANAEGTFDDERAKKNAKILSHVINDNHPSENGEYNKTFWIMSMARAYANYLSDCHHNSRFLNPGSFFLLCTIIAKGVE